MGAAEAGKRLMPTRLPRHGTRGAARDGGEVRANRGDNRKSRHSERMNAYEVKQEPHTNTFSLEAGAARGL